MQLSSMLILALEAKCGGLFSDNTLEVSDFLRIHAVIDGLQFFLGAFDGLLSGILVDFRFAQRHVGQNDGFSLADFSETGADSQGDNLALMEIAQFTGLERGHQTGVAW